MASARPKAESRFCARLSPQEMHVRGMSGLRSGRLSIACSSAVASAEGTYSVAADACCEQLTQPEKVTSPILGPSGELVRSAKLLTTPRMKELMSG